MKSLLSEPTAAAQPPQYNTERSPQIADDAKIEAFRKYLEYETLEAGRKGGEAFNRAKHAIAEYWLCIEFRCQRLHDQFCRTFELDAPSPHSPFREHIAAARRMWREVHDPKYKHYRKVYL